MKDVITTPLQRAKMVFNLWRIGYAWPGGSELHGFREDGTVICKTCVEIKTTRHALIHSIFEQDHIAGTDTYLEGPPLQCDKCGRDIEAEYGDPWVGDCE